MFKNLQLCCLSDKNLMFPDVVAAASDPVMISKPRYKEANSPDSEKKDGVPGRPGPPGCASASGVGAPLNVVNMQLLGGGGSRSAFLLDQEHFSRNLLVTDQI